MCIILNVKYFQRLELQYYDEKDKWQIYEILSLQFSAAFHSHTAVIYLW